MTNKRLKALRQKLCEEGLSALLVSNPENICYLSGFEGEGWLLVSLDRSIIATDARYTEYARREIKDWEVFPLEGKAENWFPKLVQGLRHTTLGIEARHITLAFFQKLSSIVSCSAENIELRPTEDLVESLRLIKDRNEIKSIEAAASLVDRAMDYARGILAEGMSEATLAWKLECFMREEGSESVAFPLIVASGPNAALPHAKPSERPFRRGEPIVIDIGARIGGYVSDLTRTLYIGEPNGLFTERYDIVLKAQTTALQGIRTGMSGAEADKLSRDVISRAGYAEAFSHSLGHGIGLNVHEAPSLGLNSTDILRPGMVFTVEPGIYLASWGGIRIEDSVLLEENGVRRLTRTLS